jgi:hypothetical protein
MALVATDAAVAAELEQLALSPSSTWRCDACRQPAVTRSKEEHQAVCAAKVGAVRTVMDDMCPICHCTFATACIVCEGSDSGSVLAQCSLAKGQCGCVYHTHCIDRWLSTHAPVCPMDDGPWEAAIP